MARSPDSTSPHSAPTPRLAGDHEDPALLHLPACSWTGLRAAGGGGGGGGGGEGRQPGETEQGEQQGDEGLADLAQETREEPGQEAG